MNTQATTNDPTTKEAKTTVAISIRTSIVERVKREAIREDRNVSSMFAVLVNEALDQREKR